LKYPFLIPKVPVHKHQGIEFVLTPDSTISDTPMSYSEANVTLRALLSEVGVPEDQAATYTIKSLRKFLPTAAAVWQLEPESQNAIGDWQDVPGSGGARSARSRVAMPQTYSAVKIDVAYRAKMQLVSGLCAVAAQHPPEGQHNLEQFLADKSGKIDICWLTWDYITSLNLAHKDDHTFLVKASGDRANLGKPRREVQGTGPKPSEEGLTPPAKRTREDSPAGLSLSPPSAQATRAKVRARPGPQSPPPPTTPIQEQEGDEASDGDSTSSDEEEEDPQQQAQEIEWFTQPGNGAAHFYRTLDEVGHPLPLCRKQDTPPSAASRPSDDPLGLSGGGSASEYPLRQKHTCKGFSKPPENLATGYQLLLMSHLKPCKKCLGKLPEAVAHFFTDAP